MLKKKKNPTFHNSRRIPGREHKLGSSLRINSHLPLTISYKFIQHFSNYAKTDCFYASYICLISTAVQNKEVPWVLP